MGDRTAIIVDCILSQQGEKTHFSASDLYRSSKIFCSLDLVAHRGPPYCPSTDQSLLPVQVKWENALETGEGKEDAEKGLAEMAAYPAGVQERSAEALQRP